MPGKGWVDWNGSPNLEPNVYQHFGTTPRLASDDIFLYDLATNQAYLRGIDSATAGVLIVYGTVYQHK